MNRIWLAVLLCLLLAACGTQTQPQPETRPEISVPPPPASQSGPHAPEDSQEQRQEEEEPYVRVIAKQISKEFSTTSMNEVEKAKAAYEFVIRTTHFAQPVGLEAWRVRGGGAAPSYVETRALSPLLFGLGACEDYAAALVVLLQSMGMEAQYLPGLTISVAGEFVDHAWVVAKVDGSWYHLDPQLEDNVLKGDRLTYRYFLKSDEFMLADHRWGQNLIAYGGLTPAQMDEIRSNYLAKTCPISYQPQEPKQIQKVQRPNRRAVEQAAAEEIRVYEQEHGPLDPMPILDTPPVFGWAGYGDPRY